MIPTQITVPQLFMMQCRHLVPIFQRPYVWGERNQWAPLWEDILLKANEALDAANGKAVQQRSHFMGAVVLKSIPAIGLEYPATEVIDGQQRLTTLQILLIALRDYARSVGFSRVDQMLQGLTENPPYAGTPYERYKVLPTTTDRAYFESIWSSGSPEELLRRNPPTRRKFARYDDPPPRLIGAYLYFHKAIKSFTEHPEDVDTSDEPVSSPPTDTEAIHRRLGALIVAITQRLELVRIDLSVGDDPQVIFETLNARGERLLPSDLVRNFLFLEATHQCSTPDGVTNLYETYWLPYDRPDGAAFWKAPVSQGRLTHPRFELFLFHMLTSFLTKADQDIQLPHLFRAFREWWDSKPKRLVEEELQQLNRYSDAFRDLHSDAAKTRLDIFARRLRIMDTSTVYPLLLLLLVERKDEVAAELDGIVTDLESFLVRRLVCGLTNKGYNRLFLKLLVDLRNGGVINRQAIQNQLLSLQGHTRNWPTDAEFKEAWLNRPVYTQLAAQRVVMVLEGIEWQQHTTKQARAPFSLAAPYTIEHIMPQSTNETDWPLPVTTDDVMRQAVITQRDVLKHTFGNLTLVTQPMNSSLSNGPFTEKCKALSFEAGGMLNHYFGKYDVTHWDEQAIRERGERLFDLAVQVWPRPGE